MTWRIPAKGHVCQICRFDESTVMLPLNLEETHKLLSCVNAHIRAATADNDFPDKSTYERIRENLISAQFLLIDKG
jgi:hypothetical protein